MERLQSIDLVKAELTVRFRGYDRDQVNALLNSAATEIDTLRGELGKAAEFIARQRTDLEEYRSQEAALKAALVSAEKTAEDIRTKARIEGDEILEKAQSRLNDLRWELERLRQDKQNFVNTYRQMLESQLRDLGEHGGFAVVESEVESDQAANA